MYPAGLWGAYGLGTGLFCCAKNLLPELVCGGTNRLKIQIKKAFKSWKSKHRQIYHFFWNIVHSDHYSFFKIQNSNTIKNLPQKLCFKLSIPSELQLLLKSHSLGTAVAKGKNRLITIHKTPTSREMKHWHKNLLK